MRLPSLRLEEWRESRQYAIHRQPQGLLPSAVDLILALRSADDSALVERLFHEQGLPVVFLPGDFKNVSLVSVNPLAGLANNAHFPLVVSSTAYAAGVNEVVLIFTDKAMRTINVMGASKRVAERVM